MLQEQAVWLVIGMAIVTAAMPFWFQRPLLCLPWSQGILPGQPVWLRWALSLVHLAVLFAWGWGLMALVGHSLASSSFAVAGRLLLMLIVLVLLMWWPGYQWRTHGNKPFVSRILEVLVLYVVVGTVGMALETQLGNPFSQGWEFYAVTLCLYVVLAFPGFVYRYLLRRTPGRAPA